MELELLSLAYPPLIVFVAALLVLVLPRIAGFAVGALSLAAVLAISLVAPEGQHLAGTFLGFEVVPFYVDDFSRMVGLGLGFLGVCSVIYAYSSEASRTLVAFALVYVSSSIGAAFAGDWLVLLFMWELMAVTSTLVVWHYGGEAVRAGFRYALFHGTGGVLVMMAVAIHYVETGTFVYTEAGIANGIPALLAVLGMGVNVAFIGFHTWLPDTYPRPHFAASVFLSVYTTKTSAFVLYRAFPVGGESDLSIYIAYMGGLMAVYGATFALLQHDMRALLSYHIQAQLGYIVAAIGIGSNLAVAGAMSHLFNNILFKSLLFMAVGVVIYRTGEESLKKIGGLGTRMPITAIAFGIAALSIAGFPGFNGFVSKGMIIAAAEKKHLEALWYLLLLGGVGTFLSFIKLGYHAFLHGDYAGEVRDANRGQSVAMLSVAGLCVLFGLQPELLFQILPFQGQYEYTTFTIPHVAEGVGLAAAGLVGFAILKGPLHRVGRVPDIDAVYNRGFFYGGRLLVVAITELYAAIDRVAVRLVRACYWIGANPTLAVLRASERLPESMRPTFGQDYRSADGGAPSRLYLRAGIGTSVLILVAVLTLLMFLVL